MAGGESGAGRGGRPRFLVDAMCHPLVSWLRIFDYDAIGALELGASVPDGELVRLSMKDGRVLVTRDNGLAEQARGQGVDVVRVEGNETEGHIRQMVQQLGVNPTPRAARCTACNGSLARVGEEEITDQIALSVAREGRAVWCCRRCGQHYWQGTHWANIERTAREVSRYGCTARAGKRA